MDFSPDGKLLATSGEDRTIKVWNRNGTNLVWEVPHSDAEFFSDSDVTGLLFTPDGKYLMTCSAGGSTTLWTEVLGSEATNQIRLPLSRGHVFFRLVQPSAFFVLFFRNFRGTR